MEDDFKRIPLAKWFVDDPDLTEIESGEMVAMIELWNSIGTEYES